MGFDDGFARPRRRGASSASLLKLIQFGRVRAPLRSVLSVHGPYANSDETAAANADSSRAERRLRSFMKMDTFLSEVGSHPDLVTSGGRSCHQPPMLVNLISSTSSASLRMLRMLQRNSDCSAA